MKISEIKVGDRITFCYRLDYGQAVVTSLPETCDGYFEVTLTKDFDESFKSGDSFLVAPSEILSVQGVLL